MPHGHAGCGAVDCARSARTIALFVLTAEISPIAVYLEPVAPDCGAILAVCRGSVHNDVGGVHRYHSGAICLSQSSIRGAIRDVRKATTDTCRPRHGRRECGLRGSTQSSQRRLSSSPNALTAAFS